MNRALDLAYRIQRRLWRWLRPRTRGVKLMLFNEKGEILLIRNSYGRSDQFVLPGGGVRPWEKPELAAVREAREELSCEVDKLTLVSTHCSSAQGKRDTVTVYSGDVAEAIKADGFEVEEARFFAVDALPENISAATGRRIEEWTGNRKRDGAW